MTRPQITIAATLQTASAQAATTVCLDETAFLNATGDLAFDSFEGLDSDRDAVPPAVWSRISGLAGLPVLRR